MNSSRFVICFSVLMLAVVVPIRAQQVQGIANEAGTNQPLADVEIRAVAPGTSMDKAVARTVTDLQGNFVLRLDKFGSYAIIASKPGYTFAAGGGLGDLSTQKDVVLDKSSPTQEAHFVLGRTGRLLGQVADAETGEPIENFLVQARSIYYVRGRPVFAHNGEAHTDKDGRFSIDGLSPGDYMISTGPQKSVKERVLTEFTSEDADKADEDYETSYWPGGHGMDTLLTVPIDSGSSASVGVVKPRKISYHRVHVAAPSENCAAGHTVALHESSVRYPADSSDATTACGKDFLLRYIMPGPHKVDLISMGESYNRAVAEFEMSDRSLTLTIPMGHGVDVDGQVLAADGADQPPLGQIRIAMRTVSPIENFAERTPVSPDEQGRFRLTNRPAALMEISISRVDANHDVKEIRYNGIPVSGNLIRLDGAAHTQRLDVVLDNKPASVSGVTQDGDRSLSGARVVLVKWPAEDVLATAKYLSTGDDGSFRFSSLAPGDYRIIAVPPSKSGELDKPGILQRVLESATSERISLGAGESKALKLKPSDP